MMTNIEAMEYTKKRFENHEAELGICLEVSILLFERGEISLTQYKDLMLLINKHRPLATTGIFFFPVSFNNNFNPAIHCKARVDICANIIEELKQQA